MKPLFAESLNPGVRRRELLGWAMYDFANSGYTTVVITAVFAAYFVGGVAGGASWATLAWTVGLSISYAIVMLTMPGLGAWADRHAAKKRLLFMVTAACVVSTAALALVGPDQVALGLVLLVISNTFYSYGESLTAAFLPELARPQAMGRVSGWGWALGYAGGMLTLGLCLAHVLSAQAAGQGAASFVPVTMLITAGMFATVSDGVGEVLLPFQVAVPPVQGDSGGDDELEILKYYPIDLLLLAGICAAVSMLFLPRLWLFAPLMMAGSLASALWPQLANLTGLGANHWQAQFNLPPTYYRENLLPGQLIGRYDGP